MPIRFLIVAFTVNSVISQLILRRALQDLGSPTSLMGLPRFLGSAALSFWVYASVALQILSYVMWMLIVSREKLGVAAITRVAEKLEAFVAIADRVFRCGRPMAHGQLEDGFVSDRNRLGNHLPERYGRRSSASAIRDTPAWMFSRVVA